MKSRSLRKIFDEMEPADGEIEGALSARYTEADRARLLTAGFDAIPEPEPIVVARAPQAEPPPPPPPRLPIDHPVVSFSHADIPGWGAWLVEELRTAWPLVPAAGFANMARNWTASNECHFVRTSNSAALAISVPHPFLGGQTVVRGIFCWTRFPDEKGAEHHLIQLHRHTIEWARARKALRFELFEKSDLTIHRTDFFVRPRQAVMRYVETR